MKSILFICTGNICRSPMAEALFCKIIAGRSDIKVASAGVSAQRGLSASREALEVLAKQGISFSFFRSQPVTKDLMQQATHVFAMTRDHKKTLEYLFPEAQKKIFLLKRSSDQLDISDPIGQGFLTYQRCSQQIQSALNDILTFIDQSNHSISPMPSYSSHKTDLLANLRKSDPQIATLIEAEHARQFDHLELIASENFTSRAVMEAQGSCLTNKYAEGYPGRRWYGGCEYVDVVEKLAIERAMALFGCEHVNVQPHSGSQANMAVYFSVLQPGDRILTMDLSHGGHLTHGHRANFSGRFYEVSHYGVTQQEGRIDYDALAKQAEEFKPKMITAGASAYSRTIDFERLRKIADSVGAYLFVDMAHIAGLVAGGVHPSPVPYADFVTTTTHKSLRGPRSGLIMCREQYAKKLDAQVFPGIQGGPLMHVIAAKAVCFNEALQPSFRDYVRQVVLNAKALAARLTVLGYTIVSGGTDNHVMLVDLRPQSIQGSVAQEALDKAAITVNKNAIPFDTEPITKTGGIRLGSPAMTTRGLREEEMMQVADFIHQGLQSHSDEKALASLLQEVNSFAKQFPLP
ncbi:MAG: serine hydroxymethyltransferase [Verrucomicrobia bacterium RIFCSPHIGHO2_12_FULL_41_10]|nr:MAG: serine hydroxymethyltransferase [Verrucomicrobia bacterium RIFCSPHIGHO2_12_FULL_41_10]